MRHRNAISNSYFHGRGRNIYVPYARNYKWNRPKNTKYVEVLKFIAENPHCKRTAIIRSVWQHTASWSDFDLRSYQCSLFANLLYDDFIDYDVNFEYVVTKKGYALLEQAGITGIKPVTA